MEHLIEEFRSCELMDFITENIEYFFIKDKEKRKIVEILRNVLPDVIKEDILNQVNWYSGAVHDTLPIVSITRVDGSTDMWKLDFSNAGDLLPAIVSALMYFHFSSQHNCSQ